MDTKFAGVEFANGVFEDSSSCFVMFVFASISIAESFDLVVSAMSIRVCVGRLCCGSHTSQNHANAWELLGGRLVNVGLVVNRWF